MPFRLTELYAELSVKGGSTVDAALAGVRREMIRTQRVANALGGEMGEGLGIASELFRKATQRNLEPQLMRMQANLLAATGRMRGWSKEQGLAVAAAVSFQNALGRLSFRIKEVQDHMEVLTHQSKWMFAAITGGTLGFTAAASPVLFKTLIDSFGWLSAEIGRGFTPYVAQAALMVQRLARWFHSLSDATRDNIAKWALLGIVMTGLVAAGGLVGSTLSGIVKGIQALSALYTLWIARSRAVAGAHLAEAEAATVAAAAEDRLGGARMKAAGGGVGGGVGAGIATGVGYGVALYGVFKIFDVLKEALAGFVNPQKQFAQNDLTNRLFGGARAGVRSLPFGETFSDWFEKRFGIKGGEIESEGAKKDRLLLSLNQPAIMGPVADAWKQAQMAVMQGFGPAGEQLKIQQRELEELLKANQHLEKLANPTVGPR